MCEMSETIQMGCFLEKQHMMDPGKYRSAYLPSISNKFWKEKLKQFFLVDSMLRPQKLETSSFQREQAKPESHFKKSGNNK